FREAYRLATDHGAVGRLLHELMQHTLRVGKRVHAETGIDRAGQSGVSAALDHRLTTLGAQAEGRPAPGVGAGATRSLALATLRRWGAGGLFVATRSAAGAGRLAAGYGATFAPMDGLGPILSTVDIMVCATPAPEPVLTAGVVAEAVRHR